MKKTAILALLILCSCGGQSEGPKIPPVAVEVGTPVQKDLPIYIDAIGNVNGLTKVEVRPQVSGKLLETPVTQGQLVKKGDLLFVIDPAVYKAASDKAQATLMKDKAELQLSEKRLERNLILIKKEYVAPLTADELKAQVEINKAQIDVDQATLDQANVDLDHTRITAYVDGKIGQFNFYPGTIISPTDTLPLTTIEQLEQVEVQFSLPQKDLREVFKYYSQETLYFDLYTAKGNTQIGKGKVYFIDNHIDTQTGTLLLKGIAPNDKQNLWPGEFVRVRLNLTSQPNTIMIPDSAVQSGQKGSYIFIVKPDNTVELREVKPKQKYDGFVAVDNVKLDEKVVTKGQLNLKPGSSVVILKSGS